MADFQTAYNITKKFEGGYQSRSTDSGNFCDGLLIGTNRGISAPTFKSYYGYCPTVMEMINLTEDQAKPIYKDYFWDTIRGDELINQSVANMMFDMFVNHPGYGKEILRTAVQNQLPMMVVERPFGNEELSAINRIDQRKLFDDLRDGREQAYRTQAAKPGQEEYLNGWLSRLSKLTFEAYYRKPLTFGTVSLIIVLIGLGVYFYLNNRKKLKLP